MNPFYVFDMDVNRFMLAKKVVWEALFFVGFDIVFCIPAKFWIHCALLSDLDPGTGLGDSNRAGSRYRLVKIRIKDLKWQVSKIILTNLS